MQSRERRSDQAGKEAVEVSLGWVGVLLILQLFSYVRYAVAA
jgi:hypothetical protein